MTYLVIMLTILATVIHGMESAAGQEENHAAGTLAESRKSGITGTAGLKDARPTPPA